MNRSTPPRSTRLSVLLGLALIVGSLLPVLPAPALASAAPAPAATAPDAPVAPTAELVYRAWSIPSPLSPGPWPAPIVLPAGGLPANPVADPNLPSFTGIAQQANLPQNLLQHNLATPIPQWNPAANPGRTLTGVHIEVLLFQMNRGFITADVGTCTVNGSNDSTIILNGPGVSSSFADSNNIPGPITLPQGQTYTLAAKGFFHPVASDPSTSGFIGTGDLTYALSALQRNVTTVTGGDNSSFYFYRYFAEVQVTYTYTEVRDWGDAPDTGNNPSTGTGNYNTLATDNGPNHLIVAGLKLGSATTDADDGTLQNVAADADDTNGTTPDDEDGVPTLPTITTAPTSVALTVNATNSTGSAATLACWIDFNRNGVFTDAGESQSTTVPTGASNTPFVLTFSGFGTPLTVGDSYIRCRIASVAGEVNLPTGAAQSGEVEDHKVTITQPTAVTLQELQAQTLSLGEWLGGWLRSWLQR